MSAPNATKEQLIKWAKDLGMVLIDQETSPELIQVSGKLKLEKLSFQELSDISRSDSLHSVKFAAKTSLLDICYEYFLSLSR